MISSVMLVIKINKTYTVTLLHGKPAPNTITIC